MKVIQKDNIVTTQKDMGTPPDPSHPAFLGKSTRTSRVPIHVSTWLELKSIMVGFWKNILKSHHWSIIFLKAVYFGLLRGLLESKLQT
jgi:hypothetical protein